MAALSSNALRTPRACAAVAGLGIILRLKLISRPVLFLDRLFVPDDTYYTLTIARSLARGLGPTVDGQHLTSGFQPLLALLLAPILRTGPDEAAALRAALILGALADGLSAWLLGWLAFRFSRSRLAAVLASTIWAFSSSAIATSLNGLESSLAVACTLAALSAWCRALGGGGWRAWGMTGALLGLCLVARVDTIFFVAIVGMATLLRAGWRPTCAAVVGAAIVVGPWWAKSLAWFGTIIPESGSAVREQTRIYEVAGMNMRDHLAWAAGACAGPPLFDSTWLREALGSGASGLGCALAVVFVAGGLWGVRSKRLHDGMRIGVAYATALFIFYGLYLPATWFFRRYLAPVHAVLGLSWALVLAHVWERRQSAVWHRRAVSASIAASALAAAYWLSHVAASEPTITVDQGHHGAKGYRGPARQILALAPKGAVIGSFQSGALQWFASDADIVNLDGVVDREAARAVREHRIAAFARSRGVTHLADWEINVKLFLERSGDPKLTRLALRAVGEAEPQGTDERFVLYEIVWPDP